jgi:hypothetical protein
MADLDPIKKIQEITKQEAINKIEVDKLLSKAFSSEDPNVIYKAQQIYSSNVKRQNAQNKGKALIIDPFEGNASLGYYEKKSNMSFDLLRGMARTPIIRAIIGTRKDQVAEYATPQADKYSKGFIIRKKKSGRRQGPQESDLTAEEEIEVDGIIDFILNCGEEENKWQFDSFETTIRKLVEDSLSLDQAVFEVIRYRNGDLAEFIVRDAATFRIADSYDDESYTNKGTQKIDGHYPSYVQLYQGRVHAEFYPWELKYMIRNPQTSIYQNGYGRSELEDLIQVVTSMLNSDSYNGNFFKNGSSPKGLLMIKNAAGLDNSKLTQFKKEWQSMISGVERAHKTPILDGEYMDWVDLQKNNRDMEFSKFQEYLIKLSCANYKISPEEVGFTLEGASQGGMGSRGSGKDEKKYSKEKGLLPLLGTIQRSLNTHIVGPKSGNKYELVFVGHDVDTEKEEEGRVSMAVSSYMTLNEGRAIMGLDPIEGGDVVLNPVMAAQMQQGAMSSAFVEAENNMGQSSEPNEENVELENLDDDQEKSIINEFSENPMAGDLNNWIDSNLR